MYFVEAVCDFMKELQAKTENIIFEDFFRNIFKIRL